MGADGGTIPRRDELVKEKKKPEKKDKISERKHKWNDCSISQLPLKKPIMACEYGSLYNKESILELLLEKEKFENFAKFAHIRNLKDVKELQLTDNPAYQRAEQIDTTDSALYICPVTGLEMSGKHKFSFNWTCGCVLSERATKEVRSDACHKCGGEVKAEDVIIINGDDEEFEVMKSRMETRRLASKLARKNKRRANGEETNSKAEPASKVKKESVNQDASTSRHSKKPDSTDSKGKSKKITTGSVQNDPNASETYKNLFTSCDKAKKQDNQHKGWISFNPQYFR